MSIAIQSSNELEQLRARLRKMSDTELIAFGKAAISLCRDPRCPDTFKQQLEEARAEWRRRYQWPDLVLGQTKPGESGCN